MFEQQEIFDSQSHVISFATESKSVGDDHDALLSTKLSVAAQIKAKRERLNMSQKEFADALGMSRYGDRTIRRWEAGETQPSALELKALLSFPEHVPFPNPPQGQAQYRMIDLFAGIGGFRMAMQNLGGKCVFSSEWDEQAQRTYMLNYGEVPSCLLPC